MTQKSFTTWALACALTIGSAAASMAQDSGALIDALVKKKVLTAQEAEDVRADLIKENATTNAGKLQLSNSITSLKLYGDIRLRYQYDSTQNQLAAAKNDAHDNQQSRERIRLRLGADFTLQGGFFGGVGLQTAQAADSGNQTVNDPKDNSAGFGNYNIYISKAYFGWANDYLTLIGGKQPNPFYTTDLVWDADINPVGAVEKLDILKAIGITDSPYGLSIVAGQLAFADNKEYGTSAWTSKYDYSTHDAGTDSWLFVTQLIGSAKVTPGVKVTVAPGYMTYTNGNVGSLNNQTAFSTGTAVGGNSLSTVTTGTALFSSQRDLSIITAPGDVSFNVCGLKTKVLWDVAYNTQGKNRSEDIYGLTGVGTYKGLPVSGHSSRDDLAWLAGVQVGENKKAGDWSILANYRQTGLSSVDPNLNDSDFALGYLNMQGVKVGANYNITDFCVAGITYYDAWNLRKDLNGGLATGGQAIASVNSVQVLQVDLNIKF